MQHDGIGGREAALVKRRRDEGEDDGGIAWNSGRGQTQKEQASCHSIRVHLQLLLKDHRSSVLSSGSGRGDICVPVH